MRYGCYACVTVGVTVKPPLLLTVTVVTVKIKVSRG